MLPSLVMVEDDVAAGVGVGGGVVAEELHILMGVDEIMDTVGTGRDKEEALITSWGKRIIVCLTVYV